MLITKEQLIDLEACSEGLNRFINQTGNTNLAVEVTSLVGGENTVSDLLWLAGKTLPKEKIVKFACDCALLNIDHIKPYTDKFEIICGFLKAPKQGAYAARAAARAAYAAAYAAYDAYAAAYAAYAAADAAYAAADAADAAYAAADAAYAAADAAYAAAEINKLLIELFS